VNRRRVKTNGTSSDPGLLDTVTVLVTWGDNKQGSAQVQGGTAALPQLKHKYKKAGGYTVTLRLTDDEGDSTEMQFDARFPGHGRGAASVPLTPIMRQRCCSRRC
jgi:hypothetical protein